MTYPFCTAWEIAAAVRCGEVSALEVVEATLAAIADRDGSLNGFTAVYAEAARDRARNPDPNLPLAGVPFAVKNLFDVAGQTTLAGSKIYRDRPPASQDATAIARLQAAGAILVGSLNMDEFAYGFVTENHHYGATHNPHDRRRIAGGSSGGSAAAVAAGLVPLSLGSDTNGSIRVPAALCGTFGLRPSFGRLSRAGTVLFAESLDCIGPFGRSPRDLAIAFDVMQGHDPRDPSCTTRSPEPVTPQLERGIDGLRIGVLGGYFQENAESEAIAAVEAVAAVLPQVRTVEIADAGRARAAAYLMTASEGAQQHWHDLRSRPHDFDPATRDRFLAGALMPAQWYLQARQFQRDYRDRLHRLFETVDVLLAPTTPCVAPAIGQKTMTLGGRELAVRPHLGLFTQPISFAGLPVLNVPVVRATGGLPLGVQLIAAPYNESSLFRVAAFLAEGNLEDGRSIAAPIASGSDRPSNSASSDSV